MSLITLRDIKPLRSSVKYKQSKTDTTKQFVEDANRSKLVKFDSVIKTLESNNKTRYTTRLLNRNDIKIEWLITRNIITLASVYAALPKTMKG